MIGPLMNLEILCYMSSICEILQFDEMYLDDLEAVFYEKSLFCSFYNYVLLLVVD